MAMRRSLRVELQAPGPLARYMAPKGSVALDGVSLTVNEVAGHALRNQPDTAHRWSSPPSGRLAVGQRLKSRGGSSWRVTWSGCCVQRTDEARPRVPLYPLAVGKLAPRPRGKRCGTTRPRPYAWGEFMEIPCVSVLVQPRRRHQRACSQCWQCCRPPCARARGHRRIRQPGATGRSSSPTVASPCTCCDENGHADGRAPRWISPGTRPPCYAEPWASRTTSAA